MSHDRKQLQYMWITVLSFHGLQRELPQTRELHGDGDHGNTAVTADTPR